MERRNARFKLKSEETIVSIKTEKGWDMRMPQPLNVYLIFNHIEYSVVTV